MDHFAHVSMRDLLWGSTRSREVRPDFNFARDANVGVVRSEPGGSEIPAAVTLRTVVTDQSVIDGRVRDTWHVTIAPDSEALRRRLFAQTNATQSGAHDTSVVRMGEASYDAVKALERAHEYLCALSPPRVGTYVEMSFAIARDMGRIITFHASSVQVLRRAHGWATHHNALAMARWSVAHYPLRKPFFLRGLRVWPWWHIDEPDLVVEPEIPRHDPWEPDGKLYSAIGDVVVMYFCEILESLWKATFKQDAFVAKQLTVQGYHLDTIEATRMGAGSLRELMRGIRHQGHVTMMAAPDFLQELGDGAIARLTQMDKT